MAREPVGWKKEFHLPKALTGFFMRFWGLWCLLIGFIYLHGTLNSLHAGEYARLVAAIGLPGGYGHLPALVSAVVGYWIIWWGFEAFKQREEAIHALWVMITLGNLADPAELLDPSTHGQVARVFLAIGLVGAGFVLWKRYAARRSANATAATLF